MRSQVIRFPLPQLCQHWRQQATAHTRVRTLLIPAEVNIFNVQPNPFVDHNCFQDTDTVRGSLHTHAARTQSTRRPCFFLTWRSVATCLRPSLVHKGIMPSFSAIRPTLEEPGNQSKAAFTTCVHLLTRQPSSQDSPPPLSYRQEKKLVSHRSKCHQSHLA